jgi:hypothetical protein
VNSESHHPIAVSNRPLHHLTTTNVERFRMSARAKTLLRSGSEVLRVLDPLAPLHSHDMAQETCHPLPT